MNMKSKEKISRPIIYIFSFLIPVMIAGLAYFTVYIYPGSVNTLIIYDMKGELLPTYGYLSDPGPGFDSLFHIMSGALGGGFLGRIAHDLSIFDIVYNFVPRTSLPDAIYFVTLLKLGLCGLCMSVFLTSRHGKETNGIFIIFLSACYSLMSYNFIYALWPLWMDLVMLLPLLALSVESIIAGKKNAWFIVFLALGMISDYHITYMTIIALTIYFFFRMVEEGLSFSECKSRSFTYTVHGIISAGISSFILFPIVSDLMLGKMSVSADDSTLLFIKNTPLDILKSFIPGSYSTLHSNASPNIFCGSVVLILAILWFVAGKKEIRARIAGAAVLLIYFVSFIFGPLDRVWHGFRDPAGFSVRYSFTFVFFMICFAVRGYKKLQGFDLKLSNSLRKFVSALLVLFTAAELFFNGSYTLARLAVDIGYTNRNEYYRFNEFMTDLIGKADLDSDGEYYRLYKNFNFTFFDGALYGYDGLLILDSSLNPAVVSFLTDIGIGASERITDECGITPPTASLFDFRYFISKTADSNFYEKIGEFNYHHLYRNEYALPLIFGTDLDQGESLRVFSDDPFDNINTVYSDFLGESVEVFVKQDCKFSDPLPENYHSEYTAGATDITFTPDKDGLFWMHSGFVKTDDGLWGGVDEYGFTLVPIYADLCLNGEKIGTFRNANYSYCNEIGMLSEGEEVKVSLDTSYSELGNTYIYRYDEEALGSASEALNAKGFDITYIGDKGIRAEGSMDEAGYVFISLPYNPGYRIYVDGKKTDYTSYRDTFLLVGMDSGMHTIEVKFIPRGLISGIFTSAVFLIILLLYMGIFRKKKNFKKKSVKHS
jgi:uncharacterized membrane protein YfhO